MENNNQQTCCRSNFGKILLLVGMILLAGVVALSILRDRFVARSEWQISISGQGKVSYQPDVAKINLGVQVDTMKKADEALKQLNTKINKIYEAMEKMGVKKEDIETQNYSLYPHYDVIMEKSQVTGYDANQIITVKVNDIAKDSGTVEKIISAASEAGVNQINGVVFEASNLNDLKNEARLKAIADARSRADMTASAMGVKLDKVVGWWENYIPVDNQSMYLDYGKGGVGGGGVGPVVPSGQQEVVIEVNLNYKIK